MPFDPIPVLPPELGAAPQPEPEPPVREEEDGPTTEIGAQGEPRATPSVKMYDGRPNKWPVPAQPIPQTMGVKRLSETLESQGSGRPAVTEYDVEAVVHRKSRGRRDKSKKETERIIHSMANRPIRALVPVENTIPVPLSKVPENMSPEDRMEWVQKALAMAAPRAVNELINHLLFGQDVFTRYRAAVEILDRAGFFKGADNATGRGGGVVLNLNVADVWKDKPSLQVLDAKVEKKELTSGPRNEGEVGDGQSGEGQGGAAR